MDVSVTVMSHSVARSCIIRDTVRTTVSVQGVNDLAVGQDSGYSFRTVRRHDGPRIHLNCRACVGQVVSSESCGVVHTHSKNGLHCCRGRNVQLMVGSVPGKDFAEEAMWPVVLLLGRRGA